MFNDLQLMAQVTNPGAEILINISIALLCGIFIALVYRLTYRGPGYSTSFLSSLVLLAMITAIVIMVIGNNLARAFGLVGAMSIIRFRTAVKDTLDIVYIFFSLAIGMAAGVGFFKIAMVGTLFIGGILFLLSKFSLVMTRQKEYLLQFAFMGEGADVPPYQAVFDQYCRKYQPINVKSMAAHQTLELSFYVQFKEIPQSNQFVQALQQIEGIQNINLFFDEEEF
ncbi:DUF4956 domain-containing protein [candidate division KSB1 bacterium]|nr:DUF4956 domain-containing protein [candidate division KSB1 bacterium]